MSTEHLCWVNIHIDFHLYHEPQIKHDSHNQSAKMDEMQAQKRNNKKNHLLFNALTTECSERDMRQFDMSSAED